MDGWQLRPFKPNWICFMRCRQRPKSPACNSKMLRTIRRLF